MVELKRYEIATLLSVARNDNLAAGGAAAFGDGPPDQRLAALHIAGGERPERWSSSARRARHCHGR
jgi:hypothetical protein